MQTGSILTVVCALTLTTSMLLCQTRSAAGHASASGTILGSAETNQLLAKAQQSYYSLPAHGLRSFACDVVPGWDSVVDRVNAGSGGRNQALQAVNKVRYKVELDSTGSPTVSHKGEIAPANDAVAGSAGQVIDSAERALDGFLRTWWMFSSGQFFGGGSGKNRMEDLGGSYRLTQGAGAMSARIELSSDLVIESVYAQVNHATVNLDTTFTHTRDGLLLAGYRGDITGTHGTQRVVAKIYYREVDGFQLPLQITITSDLPDGWSVLMPMRFSNCASNARNTNLTTQQTASSQMTVAQPDRLVKSPAAATPSEVAVATPSRPPALVPSRPPAPVPPQPPAAAPSRPSAAAPSQPPIAAPSQPPSQPPGATPSQAAVFILASGERVESRHYVFSVDSLQLEQQDGRPRSIPLSAINLDATVTANRERGIDLRIPQHKGEITVSF